MKFEPLFKIENNKLIKLEDNSIYPMEDFNILDLNLIAEKKAKIPENKKQISIIKVSWQKVDFGDESYNEEILAELRNFLKTLEESGQFSFIVPFSEKEISDSDEADSYIKAMVHVARRIKDCANVIGFAIPDEFLKKDGGTISSILDGNSYSQWFINEMNVKHGHYFYFLNKAKIQQKETTANFSEKRIVLYKM